MTVARAAALLLASGVAIALGGCGASATATPAALRLQREDLIAVSHALAGMEGPVATEVKATKAAWPSVVNGLPAELSTISRKPIEAASEASAHLTLPALLQESKVRTLTGPGSSLAGLFRDYARLSARGWQLIGAAIQQIEHGSATAARFARANVALYIESVYDGHFGLAQIGKHLISGYEKLGGPAAFGSSLTTREVDSLAGTYSEANDRLHPHTGVKLGS